MSILGKIADLSFWGSVKDDPRFAPMIDNLKKSYDECCIGEIETTKFSKFRLFKDTGDRSLYQETFFKRQHRLYTMAVMCFIYQDNKEYLKLLEDTIWEICDLYVWALPAHISNIEKNDNCELDLDATTMAYALAIISHTLKNKLHPLIISRIEAEIDRRIIEPFMKQRWHWEYRRNNWTSVCAGATGCVFMLMRPDLYPLVENRINFCMADYIDEYKDDGVCVEGPGYWSYGYTYYLEYAILLKEFSNGHTDLLKGEKIASISTFLQKLFLDKHVIVNYGDCGVNIVMPGGFMFTLKNLFPNEVLLPPDDVIEYNVHYFPSFLRAFTEYNDSMVAHDFSQNDEYYMKDCGWYTRRCKKYGFAARGGSNGESHNHNDVGSFILSSNDKQIICDIGCRPYTRQYFEDAYRYTFLETSSRGHNVPIINGKYQGNFRGTKSYTSMENGAFCVDFREVYGMPELKKLIRRYANDDCGVTITDEFSYDGPFTFVERLVTVIEPTIKDGEIFIENVKISFDSALCEASYEKDAHACTLNPDGSVAISQDVYLISLKVKNPKDSFSFRIDCE